MTTFYVDNVGGNDSNDGLTFATRWKTVTLGATAARIAPGDEIRVMATPHPTLVGNCTWTYNSRTVTLPAAVTAVISNCEAAWTGTTNVTSTTATTAYKEGLRGVKFTCASAFATGKIAYSATGALDLSAYKQVSFWIRVSVTLSEAQLSLRLCSDTTGDTAVAILPIPALSDPSDLVAITINNGAALPANVQSVALYADVDPASAVDIFLDHIIACKDAASPDSLTLDSLIGKVCNLSWTANTAYAVGDVRRPTQPNRNGWRYKVTASSGNTGAVEPTWPVELGGTVVDGGVTWQVDDVEDTWYPIASIDGTTVKLDCGPNANATTNGGKYGGPTETVATYKREPYLFSIAASTTPSESGTAEAFTILTGGWNRTDMSTQDGETWWSGRTGANAVLNFSGTNYWDVRNINAVRGGYGISTAALLRVSNCHFVGNDVSGVYVASAYGRLDLKGVLAHNNGAAGFNCNHYNMHFLGKRIGSNGNATFGITQSSSYRFRLSMYSARLRCNSLAALNINATSHPHTLTDVITSNNSSAYAGELSLLRMNRCSFGEGITPTSSTFGVSEVAIPSMNDGGVDGNHVLYCDGATITPATDQRHTASGVSWKIVVNDNKRSVYQPVGLTVAHVNCVAGTPVSVRVWVRRDSVNIKGRLAVLGGQLKGLPDDVVSVASEPAINTWEQSAVLTFTPAESGVVEVQFQAWEVANGTYTMWIDDLTVEA